MGDLVVATYKTGEYIGELLRLEEPKAKVRMLAVLKHPTQGDLHHPERADVAAFHQRRALAYREVANVFVRELAPYAGSGVPDYRSSLKEALDREAESMQRLENPFGDRCLEQLEQLRAEYFPDRPH